MLSSLLSAPCELKLHLLQHAIFLRPPTRRPSEDAPPTSTDEVARGLVELHVPHDRRIGGIRVKLRAVQSVAILSDQRDVVAFSGTAPIGWEDTVLMEKVVDIGMSARRSHATVPGDDSISSADRRGRSRQTRSRLVTPVPSQPSSPRVSIDRAPPNYEESMQQQQQQQQSQHHTSHQQQQLAGFGAAIARALSRPLSRPSSRSNSRSNSRMASRSQSRAASPTPSGSGHVTPTGHANTSPLAPTQSNDSYSSSAHSVTDADTVCDAGGHVSRTGLSHGRQEHSGGPHAVPTDRQDFFGLVRPTSSASPSRGRVVDQAREREQHEREQQQQQQQRSLTLSPNGRNSSMSRIHFRRRGSDFLPESQSGGMLEEEEGLFLQKGVHGFEFAFIIPADSAPYERSPYGRVRYIVKAIAFGAGRAKSNIEAWRDMFPTVNPSTDGGPIPLNVMYHDMHATVGLLSIACTANNVSVGGIFNIDIHSPTPPEDLMVYLVRVSVETNIELRTRKKGKQQVPTQRHKLFEKGWVPPRPNDPHGQGDGKRSEGLIRDPTKPGSRPDDAWTVQGIARMPNDNIVRSSTTAGTRASIRFSHQLLIEVVHSRETGGERKIKVFALRQPIVLPSCCVAYDAFTLPAYTPPVGDTTSSLTSGLPYDISPSATPAASTTSANSATPTTSMRPSTTTRHTGVDHQYCVCGQTLDDLTGRERALMPARPYADLPLDGLSHRKIGELPEPSGSGMSMSSLGSALRRSTSRSSSVTSRESASRRDRSTSRIRRSLSRSVRGRSPSNDRSRSSTSRTRLGGGRGGIGNSVGIYANGVGERGEGVIRTTRGSSSQQFIQEEITPAQALARSTGSSSAAAAILPSAAATGSSSAAAILPPTTSPPAYDEQTSESS